MEQEILQTNNVQVKENSFVVKLKEKYELLINNSKNLSKEKQIERNHIITYSLGIVTGVMLMNFLIVTMISIVLGLGFKYTLDKSKEV